MELPSGSAVPGGGLFDIVKNCGRLPPERAAFGRAGTPDVCRPAVRGGARKRRGRHESGPNRHFARRPNTSRPASARRRAIRLALVQTGKKRASSRPLVEKKPCTEIHQEAVSRRQPHRSGCGANRHRKVAKRGRKRPIGRSERPYNLGPRLGLI
jgi:hypothetical protein